MSKKIYIGDAQVLGADGKSAYQSWLDEGNTGSVADFIAAITGVGFDDVSSQQDGTVVITLTNGDTVTIDLNHTHEGLLPEVSSTDNGKIMKVVSGEWALATESGGGGSYTLPIASASTLGGVKVGSNMSIDNSTGVLTANLTDYPKYVLCASEAAYAAITTKDSGTLYLIPKTSS